MLLTKEKWSHSENHSEVDPNLCDLEPDTVGAAQVKSTLASFILYMRSGVFCHRWQGLRQAHPTTGSTKPDSAGAAIPSPPDNPSGLLVRPLAGRPLRPMLQLRLPPSA